MTGTFENQLSDILYRDAVIDFRRMVERDGVPVDTALQSATTNAGLGLNQTVQFEREVFARYALAIAAE